MSIIHVLVFLHKSGLDAHFIELRRGDAHGFGLLWDNTFGALAGDGVYLKEVELVLGGVMYVVEAHDALAAKQVIELAGDLLYVPGDALGALGGCHLVAEAVVLGSIVEELMAALGDNLGDGEHQFLAVGFAEDATVELTAVDARFHQHGMVLGEGLADGRQELLGALHLSGGHTAAAGGGLHKDWIF